MIPIKSNQEFWYKMIERNIERDKEVNEYLVSSRWAVVRFWSAEIRKELDSVVTSIVNQIQLLQLINK